MVPLTEVDHGVEIRKKMAVHRRVQAQDVV